MWSASKEDGVQSFPAISRSIEAKQRFVRLYEPQPQLHEPQPNPIARTRPGNERPTATSSPYEIFSSRTAGSTLSSSGSRRDGSPAAAFGWPAPLKTWITRFWPGAGGGTAAAGPAASTETLSFVSWTSLLFDRLSGSFVARPFAERYAPLFGDACGLCTAVARSMRLGP